MRFYKICVVGWLLCCGLLVSCKQSQKTSIPSYPVHLVLNITAEYPHFILGSGFQTLTFTELKVETDRIGYAGIVVSTGMDGNYHAHDMGCPRCLNRKEPVEIVGMYAECPICHEQYDLSYGYALPTKGISREPLRKYTATYSSLSGKLTITP